VIDAGRLVALGRTELAVTSLGLGCAPLGGLYEAVPAKQARAVLERAWGLGLRFFDTAPLYGSGLSERRLGEFLQTRPRTEFVVSTKVGRLLRPDGAPDRAFPGNYALLPVFDFSYDGALRSLEQSLERLGLDRIDIVHIHDPDDFFDQAATGAYRALERLRDENVVGAIGVGMDQTRLLTRFARETDIDCVLLAGRYTLLDAGALEELLPVCLDRGVAVIAAGVLNSGILGTGGSPPMFDYAPAPEAIRERVGRFQRVCARWGVPVTAPALQFPFGHPAIDCELVGCRSIGELDENLGLLELELPAGLWSELIAEELIRGDVPIPHGVS
jgi:D-threo-aldose 1-dehydrogenase